MRESMPDKSPGSRLRTLAILHAGEPSPIRRTSSARPPSPRFGRGSSQVRGPHRVAVRTPGRSKERLPTVERVRAQAASRPRRGARATCASSEWSVIDGSVVMLACRSDPPVPVVLQARVANLSPPRYPPRPLAATKIRAGSSCSAHPARWRLVAQWNGPSACPRRTPPRGRPLSALELRGLSCGLRSTAASVGAR